ncbi:hypothetical protein ACQ4PT_005476 [Festuca glaucescens]
MAKKQKLSHRLFSALLSFLLHGRTRPPAVSSPTTATAMPASPPHPSTLHHHHSSPGTQMVEKLAAARTLILDVDAGLLLPSSSLFPYFMLRGAGGRRVPTRPSAPSPLPYHLLHGRRQRRGSEGDGHGGLLRAAREPLPRRLRRAAQVVHGGRGRRRVRGDEDERCLRRRRVCVTRRLPRVMVEGFLSEYLGAEAVVGREMKVLCGFYTGLMVEEDEEVLGEKKKKIMAECADAVDSVARRSFSAILSHAVAR